MKDMLCVISIASHGIYMKIFQKKGTAVKIIDKAVHVSLIGKEVFFEDKLTFNKIKEIIDTVKKMKVIAEGYQTDKIVVIGTTAVRKAKNNYYLQDQLKINTGLDLLVMDKLDENYLAYEKISVSLEKHLDDYNEKNNLIVYVGSGNISFSVISNGINIYNTNIEIGSLVLSDISDKLNLGTKKRNIVIDEYIKRHLSGIFRNISDIKIERVILAGKFFDIYIERVKNKKRIDFIEELTREEIFEYNKKLYEKSPEEIAKTYNIKKIEAEMLTQKVNIIKNIIQKFNSNKIIFVNFKLSNSIAEFHFFKNEKIRRKIEKDSVESARKIAKRYYYMEEHVDKLEEIIDKIFNKVHKTHGLTKKDRYYLTLANIFRETGKYITLENYINFSRDILEASGIFGISTREHLFISKILKYFEEDILELENSKSISKEEKLSVAKLAAILKIAESLDSSMEQKIDDLEITSDENDIYFNVKLKKMIFLEKLEFEEKKEVFENVFGLKTHLVINK